ncbi:Multimeric flavodoxin WrbA [Cribrihabitans marinus]|uniref:Multimeric flavodoxin WrbA n=1 Tax=Cribrihabitans marinus TaxID=1227549 RepID=A0A1H6TTT5_9RHOB|nr:NAD(P)H-dependent oxidoreductase [Cribrihabitans marinus]GGH21649.1 flavodoxin [Cribrihabitans marinus]SEI80647.1 Multimeric flavodoxin WrbA [Cribrihabitans marinus]
MANLKALYINTSLQRQSGDSHTRVLLEASGRILADQGVAVEHLHLLDHQVPPGVYPDMTEHGWDTDDWPAIWDQVQAADILVIGTPIWLGEESSVCRILIERLYAMSGELNERGQSVYYGKVGGCVITGNEDGIKHSAMTIGFALNHLGYTIPPQADCGWIGEAGPGPSFGDQLEDGKRAGFDNDFTRRNTTIMTWNLLHLARILRQAGGYPNRGNDRTAFADGDRFGFALPGEG